MKTAWLGVFAALALVGTGCSSSSGGGTDPAKDSGTAGTDTNTPGVDANKDVIVVEGGKTDSKTDSKTDTAAVVDGTVGKVCTGDADCDKTGLKVNHCSNAFFTSGSLLPQPVCVGLDNDDCAANDGTTIVSCDNDLGVCLTSGTHQLCFPACSFADDGAAPAGCKGKDTCNVYGWGADAAGKLQGVGYCFGGCTTNDDCKAGDKCQVEDGLCVKTPTVYTKKPGDPCGKPAKTTDPSVCNCLYTTAAPSTGYCANSCKVGGAACGTGFTCSPSLPLKDPKDATKTLFSKNPTDMSGYCLKDCATDADCAGLSAYCDTNVVGLAAGKGVCQVGTKP